MKKFWNQILGTLNGTVQKVWSTVTSFKKTFSTVHGVISSLLRFSIMLVLLAGTGITASKMESILGSPWGIGAGSIMALVSLVLYIKYISNAVSFIDLIDGFVALTILLIVIVSTFLVGALVSTYATTMFTREIGWIVLAGFLMFSLFLALRVGDFAKKEEENEL